MGMFDRLLRAGEGRKVRAIQGLVPDINALEPELEKLSDDELKARTEWLKGRFAAGDPFAAIDAAVTKLEHQLQKLKGTVDKRRPPRRRSLPGEVAS